MPIEVMGAGRSLPPRYALPRCSRPDGFGGRTLRGARRLATRIGDGFGLIGCDATIRADLTLMATRHRSAALAMAGKVSGARCAAGSPEGLIEATRCCSGGPGLSSSSRISAGLRTCSAGSSRALALHRRGAGPLADSAEDEGLARMGTRRTGGSRRRWPTARVPAAFLETPLVSPGSGSVARR